MGLLLGLYLWAIRRLQPRKFAADDGPTTGRQIFLFLAGWILLWVGLDWPIGVLAAGYLLSVKTVQYLLIAYIAPGLMLLGMPRWLLRRIIRSRWAFRVARVLARPVLPLAIANAVLLLSHTPTVINGLSGSQVGVFAMDVTLVVSGLILWWPALGRVPEVKPMSYPARIGYLALNLLLPTVPASFFTFSQYPIYTLYELAPRVGGISAVSDQQVAGLVMKVAGGFLILGVMSVMFWRWYATEEKTEHEAVGFPSGK
jgi:putative membrane protein